MFIQKLGTIFTYFFLKCQKGLEGAFIVKSNSSKKKPKKLTLPRRDMGYGCVLKVFAEVPQDYVSVSKGFWDGVNQSQARHQPLR